ncbi:MAG: LPS-assembly protein LptD [Thermodesulfobacteriota bacterium]
MVSFNNKNEMLLNWAKGCFIVLPFLFPLLFPDILLAQAHISTELPVEIKAKRITYDKKKDLYVAEEEAVAARGGIKIEANSILLDRKENTAAATGDIVLTDEAGDTITGELLEIDLLKKTGVVDKARLFYKTRNLHIKSKRIKKVGKETYRIEEGRFTTCDCSPPAWDFFGYDVDITLGEELTARHVYFRIKEIPVFYSPYLLLPVKKGRQTGFLRPGLGYSDLKGIELNNSFFWAIAKNRDATVYLDYLSKRGVGKGLEYRYIRNKGSRGELFFYHFKEKDINRVRGFRTAQDNLGHPQDANDNRWFVKFNHSETLPYSMVLKVDVDEVSDDEYFLDFGEDQKDRAQKKIESNISVSKKWRRFNLVTQFRFFDNLLLENDKGTLQRLPEVTFTGSSQRIPWLPVYLSFKSSYNNFYRREGVRGHRIDLHPVISLPLNPNGSFELTPQVGFRETLYNTDKESGWQNRDLYDLTLNFKTTFIRVFNVGEGRIDKLRHSIRPNITYSYIPDRDQNDLPSFDGEDMVARKNKIDYSLTSFLTGRILGADGKKFSYRDYVLFELSQSFDIDEARWNLTTPKDKKRPFSDLKGELVLTPKNGISLKSKAGYNLYDNMVSNYDLTLALKDKRGDRLDVSYRYKRGATEYLDLGINIRAFDSLDIFHKSRFSYLGDDFTTLETVYGIEYKVQCWGISISRIERPDDRIFLATINLLGLGEISRPD